MSFNEPLDSDSLLAKLDASVPSGLKEFDAFPKLPGTYKRRSGSRGFVTILVAFAALFLLANDIGEYLWGWPDYEFAVDPDASTDMNINLDMIVNMKCGHLSVDLRDAVGDRLFLSNAFARDGTLFDIGQATALKEHAEMLSARQAIAQSRSSRGLFDGLFGGSKSYRMTYTPEPGPDACRIHGTLTVKKVTANLHITTLGHGYMSYEHVDHKLINVSHVISEFSFGPFFPDMTQPLDNSMQITEDNFVAYQYFLHVVPTTYIAPRSKPLKTHQYAVTHYTRVHEHGRGTPGIFFKFDLDPMALSIHQRTTTFIQFFIRSVGVIGGLFTCTAWFLKVSQRGIDYLVPDDSDTIAADASGARRSKWRGGDLRARTTSAASRVLRQGQGWVVEGSYPGSPASFGGSPSYPNSPAAYPNSPAAYPGSPAAYPGSPAFPGSPSLGVHSPPSRQTSGYGLGVNAPLPGSPAPYGQFPPSPSGGNNLSFPPSGPPPYSRVPSSPIGPPSRTRSGTGGSPPRAPPSDIPVAKKVE